MKEIANWTRDWCEQMGLDCWYASETPSTNDVAKEQALGQMAQEFRLYVTDSQTRGRGRGSNSWHSCAPGSQLLSSWTFSLRSPPQHITGPLIGLALFNASQSTWPGLQWSLKAPNDLYLRDKKIAGLLIETVQQNGRVRIVIGLGFNVAASPSDVSNSTCLLSENGIGSELKRERWWSFLTTLKSELVRALDLCVHSEMDSGSRENLLQALNANPLKSERWLEVSPSGDLVGESHVVSWHQL